MALHRALVPLAVRWMPQYQADLATKIIPVDCEARVEEILALGKRATPLAVEKILTEVRLPVILANLEPKTVVYTHLVDEVVDTLVDAIRGASWSVGRYTGEDKSGLMPFLHGDVDVLVMSGVGGTGLDGLQHVSRQLIVNVLPWTAAEFDQLQGRLWRQGQKADAVNVVIPATWADVNGTHWSWCEQKLARIRFKRSIADAAVDGFIPDGCLPTASQACRALIGWLESLHREGGAHGGPFIGGEPERIPD